MKTLIVVGACYLDTILDVPCFPEEDSKLRATNLAIRRGGNCPNTLEVLEQLLTRGDTLRLNLVTCLPGQESTATRRVKASFGEGSRVDFQHCIYHENRSEAASCYVIRSAESGSRTIVNYNDLPEMTEEDFVPIVASFNEGDETWWHFEGRVPETTLKCIRLIRTKLPEARISVEVEKPGREGLAELAADADVVFISRTWAESRGHASAEACLKGEHMPKAFLALCTWGSQGATALHRPTGETIHQCPVATSDHGIVVVDAIGAGDTFIAGMLYGLLCHDKEWSNTLKLRQAVDLATMKVQREGFQGLGGRFVRPNKTSQR